MLFQSYVDNTIDPKILYDGQNVPRRSMGHLGLARGGPSALKKQPNGELQKPKRSTSQSVRLYATHVETPFKDMWRQTQTIEKVQRRILNSRLHNFS